MKNKTISLFILATLVASTAIAEPVKGGASSRTEIKGPTNGTVLELDSSAGNQYSSGDINVSQIVATNEANKGNVKIANVVNYQGSQGPTIDIAAASGEKTAISAAYWEQNLITTTIKNSVANSTAKAIIDVDEMYLIANTANQYTELKFDSVNAEVAAKLTLGAKLNKEYNRATINVLNSSNVNWNGAATLKQYSNLKVAGNLTFTNTLSIEAGAQLNVTGSLKATNKVSIDGGLVETSSSLIQDTVKDIGTTINNNAELKLTSGANWQAAGKILLNKGSTLTIENGAKYTIGVVTQKDNGEAMSKNTGRVILNGGTLVLNAENALVNSEGNNISLTTYANASTSTVNVNVDQTFKSIYSNQSILEFYLADTATLTATYFDASYDSEKGEYTGEIRIYNFREDAILVTASSQDYKNKVDKVVTLYDADRNFLGNATLTADGFVTLAIPEPAEWAAIFGAIALGLAIYRRRK